MKTKYKIIRIKYDTFLKLRQKFKPKYKESASDYFDRVERRMN